MTEPDQPGCDLLRLRVPVDHLGDDLVVRAAADRVVGGVVDQPPPGQLEQASRPGRRRAARSAARRSARGARSARAARDLEVDPRGVTFISMFARAPDRSSPTQVGSRRPGRDAVSRSRSHVLAPASASRTSTTAVASAFTSRRGPPGVGRAPRDRSRTSRGSTGARRTPRSRRRARRAWAEPVRDVEEVGAVAVATDEVLGLDRRAVGRAHVKELRSIAAGTPRQTTARSIPARRRICGIWAMWPNMSGR